MVVYFLKGLLLGVPNAVFPGPFQAFMLSQTLRNGWRQTLPVALTPLVSDGPIILLVLFVLSNLDRAALGAVQMAGGLFLLYLARGAYRSIGAPAPRGSDTVAPESVPRAVLKGVVMNFLNPAPYIFWGTVGGPLLLAGFREPGGGGIGFLLGFYGVLIGGFALLIRVFGALGELSPRARRVLGGVAACALFAFAVWQLYVGLTAVGGF